MKSENIVIVGGVAGGATAAARARRVSERASITILEKGSYVSFANCGLPYFISGEIDDRKKLLLQTPGGFAERYCIDVRIRTEAREIDRVRKVVRVRSEGAMDELPYDRLILAQGGAPFLPSLRGLPSPHAFTLRNLENMDAMNEFIQLAKPRQAVIAGGGFIGVEMAEALVRRGLEVTIVEKLPQILPNLDFEFAALAKETLLRAGVRVINGSAVVAVEADAVVLDKGEVIPAQFVLFSIGIRPELEMAKNAGLEIGETGGVVVNSMMQTSDPDIYAVGDMAEIVNAITGRKARIPLAGPANRQARIAGSNAAGMNMHYHGSYGTSIVRLFDRAIGSTGLSERSAEQNGIHAASITVHGKNHASYFPGSTDLTLKLVYRKTDHRILGAQAFGANGIDKRIDVIATALKGKLKLEDLEELDLAYAPPFSSANDPINVASFMALNDQSGFAPLITPTEFASHRKQCDDFLLDVREPDEFEAGHIPGAINIPLNDIRRRISEIPRGKQILVYCQVGRRAHLALRILLQDGFTAANICGGYESIKYEVA